MDDIVAGIYPEGQRIPSVREYASSVEVNANTVMRTTDFLSQRELIFNRRGIGFFRRSRSPQKDSGNAQGNFLLLPKPLISCNASIRLAFRPTNCVKCTYPSLTNIPNPDRSPPFYPRNHYYHETFFTPFLIFIAAIISLVALIHLLFDSNKSNPLTAYSNGPSSMSPSTAKTSRLLSPTFLSFSIWR